MKAEDFVNKIKNLAPSKRQLIDAGFDLGFISEYLESFILNRVNFEDVEREEILNLIYKFDIQNLDIGLVRLFEYDEISENDDYIFFAFYDSDIIAINKENREIVVLDSQDLTYQIMKAAENSEVFMEALVLVADFNNKNLLSIQEFDNIQIKNKALEISKSEDYLDFYLQLLGYDC